MNRRLPIFVAPILLLGTFAWVFAQTGPTTPPPSAGSGERITTPSGLVIIKRGLGEGAKVGDKVKLLYTGRLTNGKIFDSTSHRADEPIGITLGEFKVIKGWEEGILGMQFGEKRTLIIPGDLAFGEKGRGDIPPNATVEFDLEVVGIERPR